MNGEERRDLWADIGLIMSRGIALWLLGRIVGGLSRPQLPTYDRQKPAAAIDQRVGRPCLLPGSCDAATPSPQPASEPPKREVPKSDEAGGAKSPTAADNSPGSRVLATQQRTSGIQPREHREAEPQLAQIYGDRLLLARATGIVRHRRRTRTVVSLCCGEWTVAKMLVEGFSFFVGLIPTWAETIFGWVRWKAEYRDGASIATWEGTPATELLPALDTRRKALSLSRRQRSWIVRQHRRIADGGALIGMPLDYERTRSALVVHKVRTAKHREPIVEAYLVGDNVEAGKPLLAPALGMAVRVVLAYHDVIALAANSRVWALAVSPEGSHRIARVWPRGLAPTSARLPSDLSNTNTVPRACQGLDVELEDGKRQDLLVASLYSKPRPKPRKRRPEKLYNGVYPVRVSSPR
jgi:hypothetical protein